MEDALAAYLASLGRPGIRSIDPIARSRRHANWRVELEDGSVQFLRQAIASDGHQSLEREAAASAKLAGTELPRVVGYELLPDDVFGMPASLSTFVEGANAAGVMDAHPGLLADLCYSCGQLIALVEQDTSGTYGTSVVEGRFLPVRTSWALEYYAMVADWYTRAHAVGADLGPLLAFMLQRLEKLLPALNTAERFNLVHGDLRPNNLLLHVFPGETKDDLPTYEVAGVVDWEFACMGDALLAFAMPLDLPVPALAHLLDGYGREKVEAWLEQPSVLDRLEAYSIGRVVQYLALVVASQTEDAERWGRNLAYALKLARERTQPGFAKRKLEEALAVDLEAELELEDPHDPVRALTLRALGRLSCRPVVGPREAVHWMGAIACALRDLEHPDEGWVKDGERFMQGVRKAVRQRGFEPLRDRNKWLVGFDERVGTLQSDRALGAFWLAVSALVHTSSQPRVTTWPVRNHSLRGLQSLVEVLAQQPVANRSRDVLFDALLGLAAEEGIANLIGRPVRAADQAKRLATLREAWEDLTLFEGVTPQRLGAGELAEREAGEVDWMVPVVLFASSRVRGLPMEMDALIGAICAR